MNKHIVYSTVSGNTEKLANVIKETLNDDTTISKVSKEAIDADVVFVGTWVVGFDASPDIAEVLTSLNNKKVFVFATAGYGHTEEFFAPIMAAIKSKINDSNEIIGEFICQGAVTDTKMEGIKKADEAKYERMYDELVASKAHPSEDDFANLKAVIKGLSL